MEKVPLAPSNVPTKFRWNNQDRSREKCKNVISALKIATNTRGWGRLRWNSWTLCPLPLAMSLPSFVGKTENRLGEKCKNVIFSILKNRYFAESWAIRPKFHTAVWYHPRYVSAKYHWDFCKIKGTRSGTKIWQHILDPAVAAASMLSKTIGPTLHVEPNAVYFRSTNRCWNKVYFRSTNQC